jgi:thiosulfate dehydrogenase
MPDNKLCKITIIKVRFISGFFSKSNDKECRMNKRQFFTFSVLIAAALLSAACGGTENAPTEAAKPVTTEAPAPPELFGDPIRGGLMYDKWWKVVGADAPSEDHPLWATQDTNTRSGDTTWRCKECHGWDYKGVDGAYGGGSHMTGFKGVIQMAGEDANEVLAALQGSTNADHDFSSVMDEQALTDLALFISEEIIDYSDLVGDDKAALSTDLHEGEHIYQDYCAVCHGKDGSTLNFGSDEEPEYLGDLALGNPWEVLHKARFGQPGEDLMPSAIDKGWTVDEQGALLAYVQTLEPMDDLVPQGGLLYDKWWNALGIDAPTEDNPLWATQTTNERSGDTTWRCKECHGWDYKGVDGAYGGGSHMTGFTGVYDAAGYSAEELTAWLDGSTNADHDFSAYLDADAFAALAAFIQGGTVDMSMYINYDDKSAIGDAAAGQPLYDSTCAPCHGTDGTMLNFGDEADPLYLGGLAWDNPWETLHKAANGQPGKPMPSGLALGWSWEDLANVLAYSQSLGE